MLFKVPRQALPALGTLQPYKNQWHHQKEQRSTSCRRAWEPLDIKVATLLSCAVRHTVVPRLLRLVRAVPLSSTWTRLAWSATCSRRLRRQHLALQLYSAIMCCRLHHAADIARNYRQKSTRQIREAYAHLYAPCPEVPIDCSKLALIVTGETKAASLWIVNVLPMSTLPRKISAHALYCNMPTGHHRLTKRTPVNQQKPSTIRVSGSVCQTWEEYA